MTWNNFTSGMTVMENHFVTGVMILMGTALSVYLFFQVSTYIHEGKWVHALCCYFPALLGLIGFSLLIHLRGLATYLGMGTPQ
jgi:hypothetical protein